jgi:hypothetical protein
MLSCVAWTTAWRDALTLAEGQCESLQQGMYRLPPLVCFSRLLGLLLVGFSNLSTQTPDLVIWNSLLLICCPVFYFSVIWPFRLKLKTQPNWLNELPVN